MKLEDILKECLRIIESDYLSRLYTDHQFTENKILLKCIEKEIENTEKFAKEIRNYLNK